MTNAALEGIEYTKEEGPVLHISGIDMCDGTPVLDIKPYIPVWDSHPDEKSGFVHEKKKLEVRDPEKLLEIFDEGRKAALEAILSQDPRPSYQDDPERVYGFSYAGHEVKFRVCSDELVVTEVI